MLKVGIVGAGNIATGAHIPAYRQLKDRVKVVAVADTCLARAEKAAAEFGALAFSSVEEMLENCEVDYVDICTWNAAHAPVALAAAKAGKAILCEKPMSDSLVHSEEMAAAVKKAGVKFMMAMVTRYGEEPQYVHALQKAGKLGDVIFAKAIYTRRRGTPEGWFTDRKKSGGGPVIDLGVHCIDRAWFLMGCPRPVLVSAATSYAIGNFKTKGIERWRAFDMGDGTFDTEDSATAFIRFENGATMFAEASWAQNNVSENFVRLYGTKAGVSFEPLTIYTENEDGYLTDNRPSLPDCNLNDCFRREISHFLDCLETDGVPQSGLADGITLQKILDGIYRSAAEGKEVTLD